MAAPTMEFKKGDGRTHYFQLPIDSWVPGGTLYFTAKPAVDNDNTDAAAVIDVSFGDTDIVLTGDTNYDPLFATYELNFAPTDIVNVSYEDGADTNHYLGEFTIAPLSGQPQSFPADNEYIDVIIYADIKRAA